LKTAIQSAEVIVDIGGQPIRLCCGDPRFLDMVRQRYAGYVSSTSDAKFEFEIELAEPNGESRDEDVQVSWNSGQWHMARGDFRAQFNPAALRGRIRQTINPYSLDSVLRIVHTLLLARQGGFLVHASSAVRNGKAFLFAGISGAGKTTMARLAPADAKLLTDEISYVSFLQDRYIAIGTPFFGELSRVGENVSAPIACLYLLAKGDKNTIEDVSGVDAVRGLLENILFFAKEPELVTIVFEAACSFVKRVPVRRLTFVPDNRVWELIV